MRLPLVLASAIVTVACATPGASPNDMSAANHDNAAAEQEILALESQPTVEGIASVKRHRQMAADHRAASLTLRDAEAAECVSLSERERSAGPFEQFGDIARVEPIVVGARLRRVLGATVTIRATPGLTESLLRRLVGCHLARGAALGHPMLEMPTCPVLPKDVSVSVSSSRRGLGVDMRSWDEDVAREILRCALLLGDATRRKPT